MLKRFFLIIIILFFFFSPKVSFAESNLDYKETYFKGKVIETNKIEILEGEEKGKIVLIDKSSGSKGDEVVIKKQEINNKSQYFVYEPYRLNALLYIAGFFLLFIVFVAGKKGIGAVAGLAISVVVISFYIIPQIIQGQDPLMVCLIGSFIILMTSTYVAHGISVKTTVAVISTGISLIFAAWISTYFVNLLHVFGLGSEEIYNLQVGYSINPKGLLLGSILIGTLGALNDITTTQAITIFTLVKENPKQKILDLFDKGMDIGREHIASLINTLVLAYAGSSLAVFIYLELNPAKLPWWVILNNESTIEEIVKSLAGSTALILAVPLTTLLAAWVALKISRRA
ncbi:MAG: YibE/F family protein [bacterium]|nr:YibE/F family protein [bacterium]